MLSKEEITNKVKEYGVLAVIRGPSAELTIKMVDALIAGGVKGIEITYSTPQAASVVRNLAERYGAEILLGMGTLTRPEQAEEATRAGATFLVSPICQVELTKAMLDTGLAVMTGALTPSEVFQAYTLGSSIVKIFPGSLTGPGYIKALRGPFPYIPMMPTGGVSLENIGEWFAAGAVAVGAGSELCPKQLAEAGEFDKISANARRFVEAIAQARM
ncbi:MAG: bifunctional 4-hydroxy-2-oxoglutarate aldolase/2-dehydro-3-deoxy-phosphogluconate aldolase [Chloroflexi bacterium]|nr:bifunctional 4-hydroxy-2-oxoglutarate aldolase/2-dehydro-3-deoxy-phosphogluconate aldolase [Chloroflexota bacterium]